jgi:adenine-specific DNA methylase
MDNQSFIEVQFPVSKVSKESYKERKSNYSQTLTGVGKWWGRKPLILVRAALLGTIMPASDNPKKDREIFLKILTMDEEGLWQRKTKNIPLKEIYVKISERERKQWFKSESSEHRPRLKKGLSRENRRTLQRLVFNRLSYDEKLKYCDRPEQIIGPSKETWEEINTHLDTNASNLRELIQELGKRRYGHIPRVGDAFCGGGSVPYEAARMGFEVFGSDLNPIAAFLTWASLNIVGGGEEIAEDARKAQRTVYTAVDKKIAEWGIEHNEMGWRADAYLYCNETRCPECGILVPLAPSWIIGEKTRAIAKLIKNSKEKRYDLDIQSGVTVNLMNEARNSGTVINNALHCPNCPESTPIGMIRGDRRAGNRIQYGLRMWENKDFLPRPDDVFQERLYCIRWVETLFDEDGNSYEVRHYRAPDKNDEKREQKVIELLQNRFVEWQEKGYIPSSKIEPGDKTDEPIRTRGWTYWHHLFNPRQLLIHGLISKYSVIKCNLNPLGKISNLLWIGILANRDCKSARWVPSYGVETTAEVFSTQALNTLYNWATRGLRGYLSVFTLRNVYSVGNVNHEIKPCDCRQINKSCDYWITDPPYADAINYHELSEFFLAWYDRRLSQIFEEWYLDSKRALAIKGSDENFRKSMVDSYRNLAYNMPDNGL